MNAPSNRDLSMACAWATAMVVAVAVTDNVLLRAVLCIPMVFIIAGHAILRAIGIRTTSLAQHVAFAVGASLAAGIAGGLVLNGIDILTPLGWAISTPKNMPRSSPKSKVCPMRKRANC